MAEPGTHARILVSKGRWLVPPDRRPANWQEILPEKAAPTIIVVAPGELDVRRCRCGRPLRGHPPGCGWRAFCARRARSRLAMLRNHCRELLAGFTEWCLSAGCEEGTEEFFAGKLIPLGMYTRDPRVLAKIADCNIRTVNRICKRLVEAKVWRENGLVFFGSDLDGSDLDDIGYVMLTLVGAGRVDIEWRGEEAYYKTKG